MFSFSVLIIMIFYCNFLLKYYKNGKNGIYQKWKRKKTGFTKKGHGIRKNLKRKIGGPKTLTLIHTNILTYIGIYHYFKFIAILMIFPLKVDPF